MTYWVNTFLVCYFLEKYVCTVFKCLEFNLDQIDGAAYICYIDNTVLTAVNAGMGMGKWYMVHSSIPSIS